MKNNMEKETKHCPYCCAEITEDATFCPYCGKRQPIHKNHVHETINENTSAENDNTDEGKEKDSEVKNSNKDNKVWKFIRNNWYWILFLLFSFLFRMNKARSSYRFKSHELEQIQISDSITYYSALLDSDEAPN